jgi:hypothetical protein
MASGGVKVQRAGVGATARGSGERRTSGGITADRLLLLCARGRFDDEVRATVEALLGQEVDWQRLLAVAALHRLLPHLYYRLRELDHTLLPAPVMDRLKSNYYANLRRSLWLQHELLQVIQQLRRQGIEVIVLKGGALAWTVYPNPALRPMADLDLLVRPEEMARVGPALEALGFHRSASLPAHMVAFQEAFGGGVEWVCERNGVKVALDIQHDLVGVDWCRGALSIEADALWQAACPLPLNGIQARQLSAEDTLIHLCLHPALHHGYAFAFSGYVDIDRLVWQVGSDPFWTRLLERVGRFQVRTVVYGGLLAAHRLLATPVPPEVLAELAPRGARLHLLRRLAPLDRDADLQEAGKPVTGVRQMLLYAMLMDRWQDAGRMLWSILFPDPDWLAARYGLNGRGRARLYRLVHPFRVARAFVRGLYRPLLQSSLE